MLWIEGAAGSGKTSLANRIVEELPDEFVVVRAEADEFASDVELYVAAQIASVSVGDRLAAAWSFWIGSPSWRGTRLLRW